jgi:hypothetical protein
MIAALNENSRKRFVNRTRKQIEERHIRVPEDFGRKEMVAEVTDRVERPSMWVVHFSWKTRSWGSSSDYLPPRKMHASFLCGRGDGQDWAVRVPGTITTVQKALDWITPAEVKKARAAKKKVFRQGDIFFLPMRLFGHDMGILRNGRHRAEYTGQGVVITHPQHPRLVLPNLKDWTYGWRAVQQKQLGNDNQRVNAD